MSFEKFCNCVNNGINRDIKSRRLKMRVSIKEFSTFSKKYFKNLNDDDLIIKIVVKKEDEKIILFILRSFFSLYVELKKGHMLVYKNFPKKFIILKDINKSNHHFTPKTIKEGTIMYTISPSYSTVNRMNGVPLWDNLETIEGTEHVPSVQINYNYISPIQ